MGLQVVADHIATMRVDEGTQKRKFYAAVRRAHKKLGTWQKTARFFDVSTATVMRWSADQHAPASNIMRQSIINVVNALADLSSAELYDLKEKLGNNKIN